MKYGYAQVSACNYGVSTQKLARWSNMGCIVRVGQTSQRASWLLLGPFCATFATIVRRSNRSIFVHMDWPLRGRCHRLGFTFRRCDFAETDARGEHLQHGVFKCPAGVKHSCSRRHRARLCARNRSAIRNRRVEPQYRASIAKLLRRDWPQGDPVHGSTLLPYASPALLASCEQQPKDHFTASPRAWKFCAVRWLSARRATNKAFSVWSSFHQFVLLRLARPLFFLLLALCLIPPMAAGRFSGPDRLSAEFLSLLAMCCLTSFLTASFADSAEMVKHMFLFNVLLDASMLALISLLWLAILNRRRAETARRTHTSRAAKDKGAKAKKPF